MRNLRVFKDTIEFLEKHSFQVFNYENTREFFERFEKRVQRRFRENLDSYEEVELRFLVFQYLGYGTRYGFGYDFEIPTCKEVWNYFPYVEDEYENQFQWINGHIERVWGGKLPISNIRHQVINHTETVKFSYNEQEIYLSDGELALLSCEYIRQINALVKKDSKDRNLYILDYGFHESVLFSCTEEVVKDILRFLNIDSKRIE